MGINHALWLKIDDLKISEKYKGGGSGARGVVKGLSSPHYERRFRAPERLFPMGISRIPNHDHEHAMWKQDPYPLVQEKVSPGLSWTAVAA